MKIAYSSKFEKSLRKIKKSQPQQISIISKQIKLFIKNPTHPSLRLHKLSGKLGKYYSLSAGSNLRIIFTWKDAETVMSYQIGTHDQVYRK